MIDDDDVELDDVDDDHGVDWGELPDAVAMTDGPERAQPYGQDPRVSSRLPRGHTVGQSPTAHAARHRAPADVEFDAAAAAASAAAPGDQYVRPAESSEALAWDELANHRVPPLLMNDPTHAPPITAVALELVRVELPEWRLAVVERLACYLRVVALDVAGAPTGTEFVTTGCGCYDPFPDFVHPVGGAPLTIRWSLLGLSSDDPTLDGLPSNVMGTPIQLQPHWSDLRFGWGQRYTTGLQLEVPTGVTSVRLVASVASAARWRVTVGGRLGIWRIGGGPRGAALRAAQSRAGSV